MDIQQNRLNSSSSETSTPTPATSRSVSVETTLSKRQLPSTPVPSRHRRILPTTHNSSIQPALHSKQESKASRSLISGPCGIKACQKRSCTLVTHRRYVEQFLHKNRPNPRKGRNGSQTPTNAKTPRAQSPFRAITIDKDRGFPELPIGDLDKEHPVLRKLFHQFFDRVVGKLHMLLLPPGPESRAWTSRRRQTLFNSAISSPVDCLNFMGAAHNYSTNSHVMDESSHTAGIIIQTKLMNLLRDMLDDYRPQDHAANVLSIIFTLANADLAAGRSERLFAHRQALIRVVDSCGGLHNISSVMPLALQLDRVIAITNALPPLCTTWASATLPIQRAALYPAVYGSFFSAGKDARNSLVDRDISRYCAEVCRAIEILEGEKWTFSAESTNMNSPEIFYFYYLRERVNGQFVHLNPRFANANSREHCILLATKIVDYFLLMDNYITAISVTLAQRLQNVLTRHNVVKVWQGWEDVLMWITLVLVCVTSPWNGRTWSLRLCRQTLQHVHGAEGRDLLEWKQAALFQARSFVWSTKLDEVFSTACAGLGHGAKDDIECLNNGVNSGDC